MSELLASYWRLPVKSGRTTKTAYLDLFDNGISANVVLFVDRFKLQLPKWVLRDFLSLGAVVYPDALINRRENPGRVLIEDGMTERLTAAGFRYNPGQVYTHLPDARTDPNATLESVNGGAPAETAAKPVTRVDVARAGGHNEMFRMILQDVGSVKKEGSGVNEVMKKFGWTDFEVTAAVHIEKLHEERDMLRKKGADG